MVVGTPDSWLGTHYALNPKILVCPSGFKESLDPNTAARCIEEGILRASPGSEVTKIPLVDGGEGFTEALVKATNGELQQVQVTGPVGDSVSSYFGILGGNRKDTAVIEMAAAAGLRLVPRDRRNPTLTTTYGVGQLIRAALEHGVRHILVGCGDSGTCDGGIGMAQALGARFYDSCGKAIPTASGASALHDLTSVDTSSLHPALRTCTIDAAVNWHNILCGPDGVARVFGPQKGASPADVEIMSCAMEKCACVMSKSIGHDIRYMPGSGASGGLGAGLMLIGAKLHPRYNIIMQFLDLDNLLDECDLVFTAEGAIDYQTPRGKIPAEVARRAKERGLSVIALAGTVGDGSSENYKAGIDAFVSMLQRPMSLAEAISDAERLLIESAESAMRMVTVGLSLGNSMSRPRSRMSSVSTIAAEEATIHLKASNIPTIVLEQVVTT